MAHYRRISKAIRRLKISPYWGWPRTQSGAVICPDCGFTMADMANVCCNTCGQRCGLQFGCGSPDCEITEEINFLEEYEEVVWSDWNVIRESSFDDDWMPLCWVLINREARLVPLDF